MLRLYDKYERMGMEYRLLERTKKVALYAVFLGTCRVNYEVFKVRVHKPTLYKKEPFEVYPDTSKFGNDAWSYTHLEDAKKKYNKLNKMV